MASDAYGPDMRFDAGADVNPLADVILERLREHLDAPDLTFRRPPSTQGGGNFSSVYAFELIPSPPGWSGSFVIRLVRTAEQAKLEGGLHEVARAEGLSAPRVLLSDVAPRGIDTAYLVMERIPGRTYLRGVEPLRFALDFPKLLAAWSRQVPKVLAALARVDTDEAFRGLQRAGVPGDLVEPGRHLRAVSATLADEPTLGCVVDWLHDNRPPSPRRLAVVHGDLWPGNVFIGSTGIQLIDWTRGGIDDPALDVGFAKAAFVMMPEPFPPPPPINQGVNLAGWSIARRLSARCEPMVGGAERVRYFEALRCAVELADVVAERASGNVSGWEHGVPALVHHLEHITKSSIDFN